jgi:hypothetical protein
MPEELATLPACWPVQFWFACDTNQLPCPASILKQSSNGAYDLMITTPNGIRTMRCCFRRGDPEIERRGPEVMERSGCWDLIDGFPAPPAPRVTATPQNSPPDRSKLSAEEQRIIDLADQGKNYQEIATLIGGQWDRNRVEKTVKRIKQQLQPA